MKKNKQAPWFTTKAWETLTEKEQQTYALREEFYQLAVHYVIKNGSPTASVAMIKRLYVPMHVGNWKMSPNYEASKDVLERMVDEGILKKVSRSVEDVPPIYFYEVTRKRAPFALPKPLQQVLREIQEKEEKRTLPGKILQEAILSWVKEETGQTTLAAPFAIRFVEAEGETYRYAIFKDNVFVASKSFDVQKLMKEQKLA